MLSWIPQNKELKIEGFVQGQSYEMSKAKKAKMEASRRRKDKQTEPRCLAEPHWGQFAKMNVVRMSSLYHVESHDVCTTR